MIKTEGIFRNFNQGNIKIFRSPRYQSAVCYNNPIKLIKKETVNIANDNSTGIGTGNSIQKELCISYNIANFTIQLISLIINYIKKNPRQEISKRIRNGNINILKEIDDQISRYFNHHTIDDKHYKKLEEEIKSKFHVDMPKLALLKQFELKNKNITFVYGPNDTYAIYYNFDNVNKMLLSCYSERIKYLLVNLKLPLYDVCYYAIKLYNMKSHSGSNWSPDKSYPNLKDYKKNGWGIIECFASVFNNQNFLQALDNPDEEPVVDYVFGLTPNPALGIVGTFPESLPIYIDKLSEQTDQILLLINPVYTEEIITEAFQVADKMYKNYPDLTIKVLFTVPYWDDLYNTSRFLKIINSLKSKNCRIVWQLNKRDIVRNFKTEMDIPLRYYSGYIIQDKKN